MTGVLLLLFAGASRLANLPSTWPLAEWPVLSYTPVERPRSHIATELHSYMANSVWRSIKRDSGN